MSLECLTCVCQLVWVEYEQNKRADGLYFSIVVGRSLCVCESKQASTGQAGIQTFSSLPDVKETKRERRKNSSQACLPYTYTYKHTTGNVHCEEKSIGQATAAAVAIRYIFLRVLSHCTTSSRQRQGKKRKRKRGKEANRWKWNWRCHRCYLLVSEETLWTLYFNDDSSKKIIWNEHKSSDMS